jgi:hypothetical protein
MIKVNKELGSIQLYTSSGLDIEGMINNKDYNFSRPEKKAGRTSL